MITAGIDSSKFTSTEDRWSTYFFPFAAFSASVLITDPSVRRLKVNGKLKVRNRNLEENT